MEASVHILLNTELRTYLMGKAITIIVVLHLITNYTLLINSLQIYPYSTPIETSSHTAWQVLLYTNKFPPIILKYYTREGVPTLTQFFNS